jgi:hypothetical protein
MDNLEQELKEQKVKQLTLSCSNMLEVLQIIQVLKKANADKPDEHQGLTNLTDAIYNGMEMITNDCKIFLTRMERFGVWSCIDIYKTFCESTNDKEQLELTNELLGIFGGK